MRAERLERIGNGCCRSLIMLLAIVAVGPHLRLERDPALHPAAARRGRCRRSYTDCAAAVRLAAGHAADHLPRPCAGGGRRRRAGGAVRPVELGGDVVLPVRGDPAGDADRRDRAADPHLCRQPDGEAAALRLDRRVLPDPVEHHAGPELASTAICSTCSSSTAPRAGSSSGISGCRRRCPISSAG